MVVIEMREAAREKAFELVDELHELGHEKKMILCELEDTLYDCFETSKDEEREDEEGTEEGTDLGFKRSRNYSMRNFSDEGEDKEMPHYYRRNRMRMRRNRMGRYV